MLSGGQAKCQLMGCVANSNGSLLCVEPPFLKHRPQSQLPLTRLKLLIGIFGGCLGVLLLGVLPPPLAVLGVLTQPLADLGVLPPLADLRGDVTGDKPRRGELARVSNILICNLSVSS